MHPDSREHFLDHDRLGDIVHATGRQPPDDIFGFRKSRHEDDGRVGKIRLALQPAASLETVDAGHDRVEQHDVRSDLFDDPDRGSAVECDHHHHAGGVERVGKQPQRFRRIVDNQDNIAALGANGHCSATPSVRT